MVILSPPANAVTASRVVPLTLTKKRRGEKGKNGRLRIDEKRKKATTKY